MGLNLPDFQCIPDWLENDLPALQIILSREEKDSLTKQKSLIDLAKFRVNAEVCTVKPQLERIFNKTSHDSFFVGYFFMSSLGIIMTLLTSQCNDSHSIFLYR